MTQGGLRASELSKVHKDAAKGLFATFLLWLISKKPTHGYGIISTLRKEHQSMHVGPSHIYPLLAGLCGQGLIRVREQAKGMRVRKLYSITPVGRKKLADAKSRFSGNGLRARFMREMFS
jgi:DNA-binding PadR family transcriptional regulator